MYKPYVKYYFIPCKKYYEMFVNIMVIKLCNNQIMHTSRNQARKTNKKVLNGLLHFTKVKVIKYFEICKETYNFIYKFLNISYALITYYTSKIQFKSIN